jgi:hypothetical protein
MDYIYHGDKLTDPLFKKKPCSAVRRSDGKCIRGANSNMLVQFEDGTRVVILARLLRKIKPTPREVSPA